MSSGWRTGEVTSFDGKHYRVIYEDGHSAKYTGKQLAQIVLSPDVAKIDIGSRVAVHWPKDNNYYEATVTREQNNEKPFCVVYDNGQYEWIDFRHRKFRLLEGATHSRHGNDGILDTIGAPLKEKGSRFAIGTKVKKVELWNWKFARHILPLAFLTLVE
jgi:hypothetical protein